MSDYEFIHKNNYIQYGDSDNVSVFIRRCPVCSQFVKANKSINVNDAVGLKDEPNAVCKVHGPVKMPFLGFF